MNIIATSTLARFIAAFVIYAVVDVLWNVSPMALGMYEALHEASGSLRDEFGKQPDTWGGIEAVSLIVFFVLIAYANVRLAIEPAIRDNSLMVAVKNGLALGCAAYATYIVPVFVATANWPAALVPIDIIIGGLLSLITSTAVTSIALRARNR